MRWGSHFSAEWWVVHHAEYVVQLWRNKFRFRGGGELGLFVEDHINIGVQKW